MLFSRFNNRIALTDVGQAVFARTTPALEDISTFTARLMSGPQRSTLVVSGLPSLAECWFMDRFAAFWQLEPKIKIHLRVEDDPIDLARHDIDLRIGYGTSLYSEFKTVTLFQDHVLLLCAPSFLVHQPGGIIDWKSLPSDEFIHTAWGSNFLSHPVWGDWMRVQAPTRQLDESKGHRVAASRPAIDFARLGLGVALCRRRLAEADLRTGRLLIASHHYLSLGHAYAAAYPHVKARKAGLKALLDWRVSDPQTQGPHR